MLMVNIYSITLIDLNHKTIKYNNTNKDIKTTKNEY